MGSGPLLGLDLGERRIGVARSDAGRRLASPYTVIERAPERAVDHRRIAELAAELGADEVVVGLPRSLDGSLGPAARSVLAELEELRAVLPVPVSSFDERFSTVEARRRRQLAEQSVAGGGSPGSAPAMRRAGPARRRAAGAQRRARAPVDAAAAAVVLQARLEADRAAGGRA